MKLFFLLFISYSTFAFTCLGPGCIYKYASNKITILFATNSCAAAGISNAELKALTSEAISDFWNSVPSSNLELTIGGDLAVDISGDTTLGAVAARTSINTILAGCNGDTTLFPSASTTAGKGGMACSGGNCRGALAIRTTDGIVNGSTRQEIITLIAHEIGHTFGLGHTEESNAVMYQSYGSFKSQEHLHQDDADGVSYLYPSEKKLGGLLGSCSTISLINDNNDGPGPFVGSISLGFLLMFLLTFFQRRPTHSL